MQEKDEESGKVKLMMASEVFADYQESYEDAQQKIADESKGYTSKIR